MVCDNCGYLIVFSGIYRLEVPHSSVASPRRLWIPLSNSRKTKGGRTTTTTDPCSQIWITMSGTTTAAAKRQLCRGYPIGSSDATRRRKRLLCAPFNDVSFCPMIYLCLSFPSPLFFYLFGTLGLAMILSLSLSFLSRIALPIGSCNINDHVLILLFFFSLFFSLVQRRRSLI